MSKDNFDLKKFLIENKLTRESRESSEEEALGSFLESLRYILSQTNDSIEIADYLWEKEPFMLRDPMWREAVEDLIQDLPEFRENRLEIDNALRIVTGNLLDKDDKLRGKSNRS